jgi:hypothetical protein
MKGWECPKCGGCFAPHVDRCPDCVGAQTVTVPTTKLTMKMEYAARFRVLRHRDSKYILPLTATNRETVQCINTITDMNA